MIHWQIEFYHGEEEFPRWRSRNLISECLYELDHHGFVSSYDYETNVYIVGHDDEKAMVKFLLCPASRPLRLLGSWPPRVI